MSLSSIMDPELTSAPTVPPAPPLPPPLSKPSSFAMKVKAAPPGWYFQSTTTNPERDPLTPPTGPYFLYGTLQDPRMLVEILNLPDIPVLRPAHVVGYERKLWGQYPALVKEVDSIVQGMMFDVSTEEQGAKLAAYETRNYKTEPCWIQSGKPGDIDSEEIAGFTFVFAGDTRDLTEGVFDLNTWLRLMRRQPI